MLKIWWVCFLFLASCSQLPIKMADRSGLENKPSPSQLDSQDREGSELVVGRPSFEISDYKVAVVVGPGGANASASAGVLKFLHEKDVKISYMVGLGMGSLAAAFYSHHQKAHEPDWQFFKLQQEQNFHKKNFFGNLESQLDLKKMERHLGKIFAQKHFNAFKVPFACASASLGEGAYNLQINAPAKTALLDCLGSVKKNVNPSKSRSSFVELQAFLKNNGADFVVYINNMDGLKASDLKQKISDQNELYKWKNLLELNSYFAELSNYTFHISTQDLQLYEFSQAKANVQMGLSAAEQQYSAFVKALRAH